ncbi:hypothetical protein C0Z01_14170 [Photobacterium kishitanii]|uniref:hypothetical protein n=1 Tax=Photobacterium kishitanii TaxID=318456 RepID=UPI0007EF8723|nr:hypothetical protein [Photobacterium kishitanii]OBU24956.1 hypothetical protein AYY22_21015 [Photobacterium kishitanii]PSW68702.1 hypothetical protein C0Z01_14170 [Photobacterium kishitanii]
MAVPVSDGSQGWSFAHDLLNGALGIEKARIGAGKAGKSTTQNTIEHYDRNSQKDADSFSDGSEFIDGVPNAALFVGVPALLIVLALIFK